MSKIVIIEDDPLFRENLILYLEDQPDIELLANYFSVEDALEAPLPEPDILLLDIGLPGMTGLEGIRHIKNIYPTIKIIMLTSFEDEDRIFKALCAGATSYLSKRTSLIKIKEAIQIVYNGGAYMSPQIAQKVISYFAPKPTPKKSNLTPRQLQIVQCLVDGLSYKLIADKLLITLETVRDHIKNIYKKLEVNSRTQVIKKHLDNDL